MWDSCPPHCLHGGVQHGCSVGGLARELSTVWGPWGRSLVTTGPHSSESSRVNGRLTRTARSLGLTRQLP